MNMKINLLLPLLAAGALSGFACTADAAEGYVWIGANTNTTGYAFNVYEYRYDTLQQKSLKCASGAWETAPIVVSFGGAEGTGGDSLDPDLGRRLSNACVRLVAINGANAYLTGAPANNLSNKNMALDRVNVAGQNMGFAVDTVINWGYYANASHVTVKGGSASGIYGAKVLEQRLSALGTASSKWYKVRRFVFGGPPTGDLVDACRHTADGNTTLQWAMNLHTGYATCKDYENSRLVLAGTRYVPSPMPLYTALTATQLNTLSSLGVKVNTFVGDQDEIFGYGIGLNCATAWDGYCWNGPQGVESYLTVSNLRNSVGGVARTTVGNAQFAKFASASANVTFTTIPGGKHAPAPLTTSGVCDVIAEGRANANPAACYDPQAIRGVIDSVTNNTIYGWACAAASPYPIAVHVYVGGSAGIGTIVGGYVANAGSEPAVASACSSFGTAYRFAIPLSLSVRQAYAGRKIYIHGIHPTGIGYNNDLIANSGVFGVPAP